MSEAPATPAFQKLVAKLREVFQIDQPDLDFGIYRIINARAADIGDYLENKLRAKVEAALATGQQAGLADLQHELATVEQQARDLGADPASLPKVKDLRARVAALSGGATDHRDAVFSHLLTFFSRYYDRGDFISQRRYKGDTYAIPYAGEEVVLHWANKDQYYTKSGENFSNYTFALDDGRRVHFRLASADTAKDDRKDTDLERRFRLITPRTVTRTGDDGEEVQDPQVPIVEIAAVPAAEGRPATPAELILWFEYVPLPKKGDSQDTLNTRARDAVLADAAVKAHWLDLAQRKPTEKNPQRTLLDKQLEDYTQKNKADYFIHKDLGGFLRRELDFYIKNEVMHLDDVQNAAAFADIEKSLRLIQCLRAIALDLVTFLAQLEDFQKKLWLKKKFVVEAHYCLTLDRLYKLGEDLKPSDKERPGVLAECDWLLAQIATNEKQIAAWIDLGLVKNAACEPVVASTDPLFAAQATDVAARLRANPFLMIDTHWFSTEFKYRLLAQLHDIEAQCDGLLVRSENFQALNLLTERLRNSIKCTYIDPPYNTGKDGFIYKDSYRHSAWCSQLTSLAKLTRNLTTQDGVMFISNDDNENGNLINCLTESDWIFNTNLIWNTEGHTDNQFEIKVNHEYITLAQRSSQMNLGSVIDPNTREESNLWKNVAVNSITKNGPANPFSEVLLPIGFPVDADAGILEKNVPSEAFFSEVVGLNYFPRNAIKGHEVSFPIRYNSAHYKGSKLTEELRVSAGWANLNKLKKFIQSGCQPLIEEDESMTFYLSKNGTIYYKKSKSSARNIVSVLRNFETTEKMKYELEDMGLHFSYPKPKDLIGYVVKVGNADTYLDYFAGSGTTAHSVININREEGSRRKYILVEVGEHYDRVIKPRIQKIIYSPDWSENKPVRSNAGLSHCFKHLRLESYEDTLNNLALKRPDGLTDLFDPAGKEDYLLHYMLDVESRPSLLSVEDFKKPFDYKLRIATDSAGACQTRTVDLVETFNYLLGLRVRVYDVDMKRGYIRVEGSLPNGEKALILWRDCDKVGYESLKGLTERFELNAKEQTFDVIYINGDHNVQSVTQDLESEGGAQQTLKLRQIEPEFIARMFAGEEA